LNTEKTKTVNIDVKELGSREVNKRLKSLDETKSGHVELSNPESNHFLAAGLRKEIEIEIKGSIGYYLGTCMDGPRINVSGNAGWYPGDNLTSGRINIEGSAGDGAGQGLYGGQVIVKGNCGSRTGQLMKGGTVIVGGNSGFMTGLYAFGGRIIVLGNAGEMTGESILGGTIFVKGEVASLGKNASSEEPDSREIKEIGEMLDSYGFEPGENYSKIVPASD